jgi:predicted nucleic acid-binding protein
MYETIEALDDTIATMEWVFHEIPPVALFLAGKAFMRYRREGGAKQNVLADFFIGAHAAVMGSYVLTRDPRRYRTYFPSVRLLTPAEHEPG